MANRKISDLTALTAPATGDLLPIVDISEAAAADKNKKITYGELLASAPAGSAAAPSFSFDGDPNTGIFNPAADTLAFAEGGSESMRIDSNGNVGIGTTSPGYPLDVVSNASAWGLNIRGRSADNIGYIRFSSNNAATAYAAIGTPAANTLGFDVNGAERLRVTSTGLVGVGTSSPTELLHIEGSTSPTIRIRNSTIGSNASPASTFLSFNGFFNGSIQEDRVRFEAQDRRSNVNGGFLNIATANTSNVLTNALHIDNAQRVGIGTTAPATPLEVSSAGVTQIRAVTTDATGGSIAGLLLDQQGTGASSFIVRAGGGYTVLGSTTNTPVLFFVNSTERARLDASGRLLVGTSSDSGGALLQVNGDRIRVGTAKTPASASATGTAGEICWDASYIYVCTATNTWKRTAIATW